MLERLDTLRDQALEHINAAADVTALDAALNQYLGKKGEVQGILRSIGSLPPEQRGPVGQGANKVKQALEAAVTERRTALIAAAEANLADTEWVDATMPPPAGYDAHRTGGTLHPITQLWRELEEVCLGMGLSLLDGPWVEDDQHNFGALNMPADHPARDMHDTFWLTDGNLMRTHTSPVQVRAMESGPPPIRAVAIGRVFRHEELDATHEHTFHQIEGFYVDREISVGHMVYVLRTMLTVILGEAVDVRLRPSYFPFVEPGFEMDVRFRGEWMELLGCGMVHPRVLRAGGIDPDEWSGFAFGLGVDRLVMMRYDIEDLRHFMTGDLRFLRQFGGGVEG